MDCVYIIMESIVALSIDHDVPSPLLPSSLLQMSPNLQYRKLFGQTLTSIATITSPSTRQRCPGINTLHFQSKFTPNSIRQFWQTFPVSVRPREITSVPRLVPTWDWSRYGTWTRQTFYSVSEWNADRGTVRAIPPLESCWQQLEYPQKVHT